MQRQRLEISLGKGLHRIKLINNSSNDQPSARLRGTAHHALFITNAWTIRNNGLENVFEKDIEERMLSQVSGFNGPFNAVIPHSLLIYMSRE
jgi:hypothetical protein